jgi:Pentapeptide repeats (8 copies)
LRKRSSIWREEPSILEVDVPNRGRGVLFVSIILFHQLDDKNALAVRLGGLYALERIARDSAQDRATIAEVLCAYGRTAKREERPARPTPARPAKDPTRPAAHTRLPPELPAEPASLRVRALDIQAVLTILGLWRERLQEPPPVLDLHDAELQGAYLVRAELQDANLVRAELQDANLVGAQLQDAKLEHSKLRSSQGRPERSQGLRGLPAHIEHGC